MLYIVIMLIKVEMPANVVNFNIYEHDKFYGLLSRARKTISRPGICVGFRFNLMVTSGHPIWPPRLLS